MMMRLVDGCPWHGTVSLETARRFDTEGLGGDDCMGCYFAARDLLDAQAIPTDDSLRGTVGDAGAVPGEPGPGAEPVDRGNDE